MHQNTFGGRALPGPAGELMCSTRPHCCNGGPTSKGREKREGGLLIRGGRKEEGPTSQGNGGEKGWKGRGREFPPPKAMVSKINTKAS